MHKDIEEIVEKLLEELSYGGRKNELDDTLGMNSAREIILTTLTTYRTQLIEEERERIRTAIKEKSGWTKNPSYHLEVSRRLEGNYLTENIKPEALAQVTLEAEEVKIEEILRLLTPTKTDKQ